MIYDAQREAYILTVLIGEERDWLSFDVAEVRRALAAAKDALVKRGYPDLSV